VCVRVYVYVFVCVPVCELSECVCVYSVCEFFRVFDETIGSDQQRKICSHTSFVPKCLLTWSSD